MMVKSLHKYLFYSIPLAYWAIVHSRPQSKGFVTDVCVPISKLTDCLLHAQQLAQ